LEQVAVFNGQAGQPGPFPCRGDPIPAALIQRKAIRRRGAMFAFASVVPRFDGFSRTATLRLKPSLSCKRSARPYTESLTLSCQAFG